MRAYIISWNGESAVGGLERVVKYQREILEDYFETRLVTLDDLYSYKKYSKYKRFRENPVINAILMSLYINRISDIDDIIIAHGYNAPFVKADYLFVHGNWWGYENAIGISLFDKRRIMALLEFFAGKNARKLVAVSHNAQIQWREFYHLFNKEIYIVNNCVNTKWFYPEPKKEKKGLNIIFCGRLTHGKGLERLLELANYIEGKPKYELTIATQSRMNIEMFQGLKNTKVKIGLQFEELRDFYNEGSVMYFPSLYEGFEMVTTESLACGVPVLGNAIGALKELNEKNFPGIEIDCGKEMKETIKQLERLSIELSLIHI